jgi:hypothetical protein
MRFTMDYTEGEWWELVVIKPPYPITDNLASSDGRVKLEQAILFKVLNNSQNIARTHCFSGQST